MNARPARRRHYRPGGRRRPVGVRRLVRGARPTGPGGVHPHPDRGRAASPGLGPSGGNSTPRRTPCSPPTGSTGGLRCARRSGCPNRSGSGRAAAAGSPRRPCWPHRKGGRTRVWVRPSSPLAFTRPACRAPPGRFPPRVSGRIVAGHVVRSGRAPLPLARRARPLDRLTLVGQADRHPVPWAGRPCFRGVRALEWECEAVGNAGEGTRSRPTPAGSKSYASSPSFTRSAGRNWLLYCVTRGPGRSAASTFRSMKTRRPRPLPRPNCCPG